MVKVKSEFWKTLFILIFSKENMFSLIEQPERSQIVAIITVFGLKDGVLTVRKVEMNQAQNMTWIGRASTSLNTPSGSLIHVVKQDILPPSNCYSSLLSTFSVIQTTDPSNKINRFLLHNKDSQVTKLQKLGGDYGFCFFEFNMYYCKSWNFLRVINLQLDRYEVKEFYQANTNGWDYKKVVDYRQDLREFIKEEHYKNQGEGNPLNINFSFYNYTTTWQATPHYNLRTFQRRFQSNPSFFDDKFWKTNSILVQYVSKPCSNSGIASNGYFTALMVIMVLAFMEFGVVLWTIYKILKKLKHHKFKLIARSNRPKYVFIKGGETTQTVRETSTMSTRTDTEQDFSEVTVNNNKPNVEKLNKYKDMINKTKTTGTNTKTTTGTDDTKDGSRKKEKKKPLLSVLRRKKKASNGEETQNSGDNNAPILSFLRRKKSSGDHGTSEEKKRQTTTPKVVKSKTNEIETASTPSAVDPLHVNPAPQSQSKPLFLPSEAAY